MNSVDITPQLLLRAYAHGLFPMAESADDDRLFWLDPPKRGVIPLWDGFHIPRSLRRTLRRGNFAVTVDLAFAQVIRGCAQPTPDRPSTWINRRIITLFGDLHDMGYAHSIEVWRPGTDAPAGTPDAEHGMLLGGLYGVALGGAFFGESMFSRATDASKVALVHLVSMLRGSGFSLLDSQFMTDHLRRFGGYEMNHEDYKADLEDAMTLVPVFPEPGAAPALDPAFL